MKQDISLVGKYLFVTALIAIAFNIPNAPWLADSMAIVIWVCAVLVIVAIASSHQEIIADAAAKKAYPVWVQLVADILWILQAVAIAFSGRAWLSAAWLLAGALCSLLEAEAEKERARLAKEGLPPAQVKCPGHR